MRTRGIRESCRAKIVLFICMFCEVDWKAREERARRQKGGYWWILRALTGDIRTLPLPVNHTSAIKSEQGWHWRPSSTTRTLSISHHRYNTVGEVEGETNMDNRARFQSSRVRRPSSRHSASPEHTLEGCLTCRARRVSLL